MNARLGNALFGFVIILFAAFVYYESSKMPPDAGGFPILISWLMAGAGVILVLKQFKNSNLTERLFANIRWPIFIACIALWILAIALMPIVGFFSTTTVFLLLTSWLLIGKPTQPAALLKVLAFATIMTAAFWFLFVHVLQLNMPEGFLF